VTDADVLVDENEHELWVARLAAVHSALAPERRQERLAIILHAVLKSLQRGPLSTSEVGQQVAWLWSTAALGANNVEAALSTAATGSLVVQEIAGGVERWSLSATGREQVEREDRWARSTLEEFEQELYERLTIEAGIELDRPSASRLTAHLEQAVIEACGGSFEVDESVLAPDRLYPVRIDAPAALRVLRQKLVDADLLKAMAGCLTDVLNPNDSFGSDLVRLVMTGNILQAMAANRDLGDFPPIAGSRLVLDTPTLKPLIDERGSSERLLFEEMVERSQRAGAQLIVLEHTLTEWDRLWEGAATEVAGTTTQDLKRLYDVRDTLRSPIARAYVELYATQRRLSWAKFAAERRDIRPRLSELNIFIMPHANTDEDVSLVEGVRKQLLEWSADTRTRATRTPNAAEADAETCAMVARLRAGGDPGEPPTAWMISDETLTSRAYRQLCPHDAYPLAVTPAAWILYLSQASTDDPASVAQLALRLSDAAARSAYFSMASSYSIREAVRISKVLGGKTGTKAEDLRALVRSSLETLFAEARIPGVDLSDRVESRALSVLNDRVRRQEERTRRDRQRVMQKEIGLDALIASARSKGHDEAKIEAAQELSDVAIRARKYKRGFVFTLLYLPLVSLAAYAISELWITGIHTWTVGFALLALLGAGLKWALDDIRAWQVVSAVFLFVGTEVVLILLSSVIQPSSRTPGS
jgi:hypothetical protein